MKKNLICLIISMLVCIFASILVEVFGFNFSAIFSDDKYSSNVAFSSSVDGDKKILKLDLTDRQVKKLVVNYNAAKDVKYTLRYHYSDIFDNDKENIVEDIFDDSFHSSITNLNNSVRDVSIEYMEAESIDLNIDTIAVDNSFHFNFTRVFFTFLLLMLVCSLVCFYKDGFKTEKIHIYFAIVCSLLGTMVIVAQPSATYYSWDDQIHFQNTIDLFRVGATTYSTGEYHLAGVSVVDSAGRNSINSIDEQQSQNDLLNSNEDVYIKNVVFAPTYNKVGYLPMAIGYNVAKLINLPFSICFRIGKIFNLLLYVLLVAYAIKTLRFGKRLFTVIALLPTNIFLASEYSYDPAVFAGMAVFIAHLVNLFLDKKAKFDFKTGLILIASISYTCFVKAIYVPFALLILLIPKNRFASAKQSCLVKIGFIGIAFLLAATFVLPAISGTMSGDSRGGSTSVNGQLSLILSNPSDYVELLNRTSVAQFGEKMFSGFSDFAYIKNHVDIASRNFSYVLLFLIFFLFILDNRENELTRRQRLFTLLASTVSIILIWTALYLSFTPVGANSINGVQNRYFVPLLFPILICLQPKNIKNNIRPGIINGLTIAVPAIIMVVYTYYSILIPYSF